LQNPEGLALTALDADLLLLYFFWFSCCADSWSDLVVLLMRVNADKVSGALSTGFA
jgi:hypothetical protein